MSDSLHTRFLSEQEFAALRAEWQALLSRSDADPLFMSWDWQWLWWQSHRRALAGTLRVLAVYSSSQQLLGLVPLFEQSVRVRGLAIRRVGFIGLAWHDASAFFSEYLDFIVDRSAAPVVLPRIEENLRAMPWDELVMGNVKDDSLAAQTMRESIARFATIRPAQALVAYRVALAGGFQAFLAGLHQSVRRRVFNHRRRLGTASLRRARLEDVDGFLATLARFKRARWGERYADSDSIRRFEHELALALLARGQLELTALEADGRVVGVMYNAVCGTTEYYLQSAFDPELTQGVSLGYLHFGYAMESAAERSVTQFDLLAGEGLSTDYKRTLASQSVPLVSYQAVRPAWLRALYAAHDLWQAAAPTRV